MDLLWLVAFMVVLGEHASSFKCMLRDRHGAQSGSAADYRNPTGHTKVLLDGGNRSLAAKVARRPHQCLDERLDAPIYNRQSGANSRTKIPAAVGPMPLNCCNFAARSLRLS